ncbi:ABC transporter substrate-binding protein [Niveibacterium sp. SC-1]|uniref:ABC transporter substrate-binding protein n=1 Tax=Niveibacterium sp. SC-1 TaxID=3135646 RepID=UPI00311E3C85
MNRRRFLLGSGTGAALFLASPLASAQSSRPWVIGQSVDLSGPTQNLGRDYFTGAKLCFDQVNRAGGIQGRNLKLIQRDDGGLPQRSLDNLASLLGQDGADVLFGFTGDACVDAVTKSALFKQSERVLFAPMSGAGDASEQARVRYLRATYGEEVAAILATFRGAGLKSFAIAHASTATGRNARDAALALAKTRGIVATTVPLSGDAARLDKEAEAVLKLQPQAVVILADTIPTALLARALRARDPGLFVCATSGVDQNSLREVMGPAVAAGIVLSRVVPDPVRSTAPAVREFVRAFATNYDETPTPANLEGYLAARVLVEGLRRAGPSAGSGRLAGSLQEVSTSPLAESVSSTLAASKRYVDTSVITRSGAVAS